MPPDSPSTHTVADWLDLQKHLFDVSFDTGINRFRQGLVFRGLNSVKYHRMQTSLMRLGGEFAKKERHLIRNFRKYAYLDVNVGDSDWHWLAVGQHYGLPTRLLDWTYSPYVAAHFATSDLEAMDQDGLIFAVDVDVTNRSLPPRLRTILDTEGAHVFTPDLLRANGIDIGTFDQIGGDFVAFLEPPSLDQRIVNQFAVFSVMSNPALLLDDWLQSNAIPYRTYVIPKDLKWEIRDKLDQANITERVIFPGPGGLSSWLTRHYYTKPIPTESDDHYDQR
jgi:FRG domain